MRRIASLLLLLPALAACGPTLSPLTICHPGHAHYGRADSAMGLAVNVAALAFELAAIEQALPAHAPPQAPIDDTPRPALPPSARDAIPPGEARPFDGVAARAALGRVDLAPCRDDGAPRGFVHAKVAFGVDGRVTRVLIDGPPGLSKEAVACVGGRLGEARVERFAGRSAEVGFQPFVP